MRPEPEAQPEPMAAQFRAKAHRDLAAAEVLAGTGDDFHDLVCFQSQQAVEKMLEAALLAWSSEPPRTHDVSFLLERLSAIRPVPPELAPLCAQLADLGVAPRYPGWDPGALHIDARVVLEAAKHALTSLEPLLGPGAPRPLTQAPEDAT